MKVLQVNYTDVLGYRFNGGAMAAWLRGQGHESLQAVSIRMSSENTSVTLGPGHETVLGRYLGSGVRFLESALSLQSVFYPQSFLLYLSKEFRASNLVHYHIIHNYFFSLLAFPLLTASKPSVWTLQTPGH